MEPSERVKQIPPYLFAEISSKTDSAKKKGVDVISLGIGDPDMATPAPVVEELCRAAKDARNHHYPDYEGMPAFRQSVSEWYKRRHNVELDADKEVIALIGGKEGSLHIALATLNVGDYALIPSPAYTPYRTGTIFANGRPYIMPLLEKNGFLPKLEDIPAEVAKKAKLLFINYPNNPTGAIATREFYKELIDFARENDIAVCSDNPYSEIGFDGYKPLSFLEVKGANEVGIEINSLSKPYNMTGWRIAMAVGNEKIISAMKITKNNVDSGVWDAVQYAAIKALSLPDSWIDSMNAVYQKRRNLVAESLESVGINVRKPKGALYIWVPVPKGETSAGFAEKVLEKAGVVVTPGNGYGQEGEGYVRISLTVPDERLNEAMDRIRKAMK